MDEKDMGEPLILSLLRKGSLDLKRSVSRMKGTVVRSQLTHPSGFWN